MKKGDDTKKKVVGVKNGFIPRQNRLVSALALFLS